MAYVAGTDLTFDVELVDANGAAISAASVQYQIVDGTGNVLQGWGQVTPFTAGSTASVQTTAAINTLVSGLSKDVREIEFLCTLADGSQQYASFSYFIETPTGILVRGTNTLVTLAGAELLADSIPDLGSWKTSNRQQKITALLAAYQKLGNLRLAFLDNFYYDWGTAPFRRTMATSILDLTQDQVLALDPKMIYALSMGQVSEADSLLSADPIDSRRMDGVILESVGDVKQMFRSGKPLDLPVSRRTLKYVNAYTTVGAKITGRV
jgi:hypothetical protein